jgi:hypothetical protein
MSYVSLVLAAVAYLLCTVEPRGHVGLLLPGLALVLAALTHLAVGLAPASFGELARRVAKSGEASRLDLVVAWATLGAGLMAILGFFVVYFVVLAGHEFRGSADAHAALCMVFAGFALVQRGFTAIQDHSMVADASELLRRAPVGKRTNERNSQ